MLSHYSDTDMLRGLVSHDNKILRAFYSRYSRSIRRYIRSNQGSSEDARDIFQEVLLVIFRRVRSGSFTLTCSLGTYLYSVSKLLWLKELRRRKRFSDQPAEWEAYTDEDMDLIRMAEYNERQRIYRRHFEQLSEACRKVLALFLDGKSIAEITALMGYKSDQHTRNRRYRCKETLINRIRGISNDKTVKNGNDKDH